MFQPVLKIVICMVTFCLGLSYLADAQFIFWSHAIFLAQLIVIFALSRWGLPDNISQNLFLGAAMITGFVTILFLKDGFFNPLMLVFLTFPIFSGFLLSNRRFIYWQLVIWMMCFVLFLITPADFLPTVEIAKTAKPWLQACFYFCVLFVATGATYYFRQEFMEINKKVTGERDEMDRKTEQTLDLLMEYALGRFSNRLPVGDEGQTHFDALFAGVNMMGEELEHAQKQLKSAEHSMRMAAIGEMASGIAHEINTPLGAMKMGAESVAGELGSGKPDIEHCLMMVNHCQNLIEKMSQTVDSLRSVAREDSNEMPSAIRVSELLDDLLSISAERVRRMGVDLKIENEKLGEIEIYCRNNSFLRALLNLLNNSVDAVDDVEKKEISICLQKQGQNFSISVIDSGHGIPDHVKDNIFDPYFTTKPIGKGTGMGLALAKKSIEDDGGQLKYLSVESRTCFEVQIPLHGEGQGN